MWGLLGSLSKAATGIQQVAPLAVLLVSAGVLGSLITTLTQLGSREHRRLQTIEARRQKAETDCLAQNAEIVRQKCKFDAP